MASAEDIRKFGQFAQGFAQDKNIDRHKCQRVTPLEVLHLAHSRTGTLSRYPISIIENPIVCKRTKH